MIAALRKLQLSTKADYYTYRQCYSRCSTCCNEMPRVAAAYKEVKKTDRVELIPVSHEETEDDAKAFQQQYKAKFPTVMVQEKDIDKLPGFSKPNGIPHAIFVDKNGKVLMQGHGALVEDWKQYTIDKDAAAE